MTVGALKKLLGTANVFCGIAVLVFLLYVVRQSSAFPQVHRKIQPGSVVTTQKSIVKRRSATEYRACWISGIPQPETPKGTVATAEGPTTAIGRYKFYSAIIMKSSAGTESWAEISDGSEERLYTEKEMVGEYRLAQIFPEKVILEKGGQTFTLDRVASPVVNRPSALRTPASSRSRGTPSRGRSSPPRSSDGRQPKVINEGGATPGRGRRAPGDDTSELMPEDAPGETGTERRLIVPAKEKDYIVENFPKILHEVKLQTELEEDGSMSGVKVGYVKSGSVLSRIGRFRSGDIIRKVNGNPVNSIQQAVSLYEDLTKQNVQNVSVEIERKGQVFTHAYSIAGSGR